MNRETKLALILGLAVILVVGMLVGDHFSKARQPRAAGDLLASTGDASGVPVDPTASSAPAATGPMTPAPPLVSEPAPVASAPSGAGQANTPPAAPAPVEPGVMTMGGKRDSTSTTPGGTGLPGAFSAVPGPIVYGSGQSAPTSSTTAPNGNGPGASSSTTPTPAGHSALPVSKGKESGYVIKAGDTLTKIAAKVYGDGQLWKQLAEYNKSRVKPENMREGVTIRIPPKDVLLGKASLDPANAGVNGDPTSNTTSNKPAGAPATFSPVTPAKDNSARPADKPSTKPAAAAAQRTYTVKKGDTLGGIASSQLGSSSRWKEILDLNRQTLSDESSLRIDMVLRLPAK